MFLTFAQKEIKESAEGLKRFENTGEPFEVPEMLGNELLTAKTKLRGETVNVFKKYEKKISQSTLSADFPMRDELEENGIFTLEQVRELKFEDHSTLKGIGKTTMQRILDAANTEGDK